MLCTTSTARETRPLIQKRLLTKAIQQSLTGMFGEKVKLLNNDNYGPRGGCCEKGEQMRWQGGWSILLISQRASPK